MITLHTPLRHPRLRYVLRVVGDDLGYTFRFHNDRSVFPRPPDRYAVHYASEGHPALPHHPFLSGKELSPACTALRTDEEGLPVFCQTPSGPDLLACIFFALSRYEEYQPHTPDAHGRFPAAAGHARQHGYLYRPVVREWTAALGRRLRAWFPDLPPPREHAFQFRPSYDIDLLWAYRYRGWRGSAHLLKDALTGHPRRAYHRLRASDRHDPFFTLDRLTLLHHKHRLRPTYFWLVSDGTLREDPNPYPIPERQRELMRELDGQATQGLHPSYRSSVDTDLIATERDRLQLLLGRPVTASRQHYLRFRLPGTYRALLDAGITDDYTMGYADDVGWRAGTNLPFPWYDLERERETSLTVHPFAAMDVTLRQYLGLAGGAAGEKISELRSALNPHGGPFMLLWHNSSFAEDYGWAGWWEMYAALVAELAASPGQTGRAPRADGPH